MRLAVVTLSGASLAMGRSTVSDDRGQFAFDEVPEGHYTLRAAKPAYISNAYGAKRPGRPGTSIGLAPAQRLTGLTIVLPRGAVITGTIRDQSGQPAAGVSVSAVPSAALRSGGSIMPEPAKTDDRGVYRLFGLAPGDYLVSASVRPYAVGDIAMLDAAEIDASLRELQQPGGRSTAPVRLRGYNFAPTYYPGATNVTSASPVTLVAGDERGNVDFALQLVPTATVSGTIRMADGSSLPSVRVAIEPDTAGTGMAPSLSSGMLLYSSGDRFSFRSIAPGAYKIAAMTTASSERMSGPPGAAGTMVWAMTTVAVNGADLSNVGLTLRPGFHFAGQAVFDAAAPADLSAIRIALRPEWPQLSNGIPMMFSAWTGRNVTLAQDGAFDAGDLMPGRYAIEATGPGVGNRWWLRSAIVNGRDLLDYGLEIDAADVTTAVLTFSDKGTELSGRLQTPDGGPATEYFIIVFPADRALWRPGSRRIVSTRPGTDGRFEIRTLPGGQYLIAALSDVEPDDLRQPSFLGGIAPASINVTLADGERKTQNLKIGK